MQRCTQVSGIFLAHTILLLYVPCNPTVSFLPQAAVICVLLLIIAHPMAAVSVCYRRRCSCCFLFSVWQDPLYCAKYILAASYVLCVSGNVSQHLSEVFLLHQAHTCGVIVPVKKIP